MKYKKYTLKNGLRIVLAPTQDMEMVVVMTSLVF